MADTRPGLLLAAEMHEAEGRTSRRQQRLWTKKGVESPAAKAAGYAAEFHERWADWFRRQADDAT